MWGDEEREFVNMLYSQDVVFIAKILLGEIYLEIDIPLLLLVIAGLLLFVIVFHPERALLCPHLQLRHYCSNYNYLQMPCSYMVRGSALSLAVACLQLKRTFDL